MLRSLVLSSLSVVLTLGPQAAAQCPNDDGFEDNDTELTASVLPLGLTTGLSALGRMSPGGKDLDYWRIPAVPAGHRVIVDITNHSANNPLSATLSISQLGDANHAMNILSLSQVTDVNATGAPQDYILLVEQVVLDAICDEYSLDVIVVPDICVTAGDDLFEDNDDCNSPALLLPGTYVDLQMRPEDRDYYSVVVPYGYDVTVDQIDSGTSRGLMLDTVPLCLGAASPDYQIANNGPAGARSLTHSNQSGAPQTVYLRSLVWNDDCARYDLSIHITPASCVSIIDDVHEPNNDCASAINLPLGMQTDFFVDKTLPDYFSIQVLANQALSVDQTFDEGANVHELALFSDAACTQSAGAVWADSNANRALWTNQSGATTTVYLRCSIFADSEIGCGRYDLVVLAAADPCSLPGADDFAEDNESCATASPVHDGIDLGLFVSKQDVDYYEFSLQPGEYFFAALDVYSPLTDVELYVFDDSANCNDLVSGWISHISYPYPTDQFPFGIGMVNWQGTAHTYYLLVRVPPSSEGDCTQYGLFTRRDQEAPVSTFCYGDGSAGPQGAHDVDCPCGNASAAGSRSGCVNSQGHGAKLRLLSGATPALQVSQARPHRPAMLVRASTLTASAFSDGILCMGNPTERLEVLFLDQAGQAVSTIDLAAEAGALVGDRSYYQVWYRDPMISPCGSGSNFTNGVVIRW